MSRDSPTLDELYGPGASEADGYAAFQEGIVDEILAERARQVEVCKHGGDTNSFDRTNTQNDWVAYITAYAGRASAKVGKNHLQGETFRENMIKVAALVVAAIEAHDQGFC